jgi:catechol 2,3-dioxygenase-like lactoylglutathione lyase family enzyme
MEQLRIDHFVLTVADVEGTCDFHGRILGMEVVTFGDQRDNLPMRCDAA